MFDKKTRKPIKFSTRLYNLHYTRTFLLAKCYVDDKDNWNIWVYHGQNEEFFS